MGIKGTDDCIEKLNSLLEKCNEHASAYTEDYEAVEYATEIMRKFDEVEHRLIVMITQSQLEKTEEVKIEEIIKIIL